MTPQLAVIVPTYNERENIRPLLDRLQQALEGIEYEVILVDDDSPDRTFEIIRQIACEDARIRLLHRIHRRGLSSACLEGMLCTAAPFLAVLDADGQHDETRLPFMLQRLRDEQLDLVVGSRFTEGGSMGDFPAERRALSSIGKRLSAFVCHCDLRDPMSGFFVLDARFFATVARRVSGLGFKILVDLVASSPKPVRIVEVPFRFGQRTYGESKLDTLVVIEYVQLLLDKTIGDYIPPKYVLFSLVGSAGVLVYLGLFWTLLHAVHLPFIAVLALATVATMTLNFFLNNNITYRERRLRGLKIIPGLLTFYAACSVGALMTLRLTSLAMDAGAPWYAGGLFGLAISSVWNYGVTRLLTWRSRRRNDISR